MVFYVTFPTLRSQLFPSQVGRQQCYQDLSFLLCISVAAQGQNPGLPGNCFAQYFFKYCLTVTHCTRKVCERAGLLLCLFSRCQHVGLVSHCKAVMVICQALKKKKLRRKTLALKKACKAHSKSLCTFTVSTCFVPSRSPFSKLVQGFINKQPPKWKKQASMWPWVYSQAFM